MGRITVNTEQVEAIASELDRLNQQLSETLNEGKATIDNLRNTWQSEAAEETISSFDEFAANFFQNYADIINQYVLFLRNNVAQGYFDAEVANISLADAFK